MPGKETYQSFLIRFWTEAQQAQGLGWRFVLVDPATGKQHAFRSLQALFDYLAMVTGSREEDGAQTETN